MIAGSGGLEGKNKRQLRKIAQMAEVANAKDLANTVANANEIANGNGTGGKHVNGTDADVEMNGNDDDEKHEDEGPTAKNNVEEKVSDGAWVSCLAASEDGQWLASSDTRARVTIYNLDTLQVSPGASSSPSCPPPSHLMRILEILFSVLQTKHTASSYLLPSTCSSPDPGYGMDL